MTGAGQAPLRRTVALPAAVLVGLLSGPGVPPGAAAAAPPGQE